MKKLILILLMPLLLLAGELNVDRSAQNQVKFISDAPLESFEGVTDNIDGYIQWQGADMTDSSVFYLEVDLSTLDTGIGLRNRHMREQYLHTDKYQFAVYTGKIEKVDEQADGSLAVRASGTFKLHGVEKPLTVEGVVQHNDTSYTLQAQFIVALTDYNIKVPQLMFMKVDENMDLRVNVTFKKVELTF